MLPKFVLLLVLVCSVVCRTFEDKKMQRYYVRMCTVGLRARALCMDFVIAQLHERADRN